MLSRNFTFNNELDYHQTPTLCPIHIFACSAENNLNTCQLYDGLFLETNCRKRIGLFVYMFVWHIGNIGLIFVKFVFSTSIFHKRTYLDNKDKCIIEHSNHHRSSVLKVLDILRWLYKRDRLLVLAESLIHSPSGSSANTYMWYK